MRLLGTDFGSSFADRRDVGITLPVALATRGNADRINGTSTVTSEVRKLDEILRCCGGRWLGRLWTVYGGWWFVSHHVNANKRLSSGSHVVPILLRRQVT